MVKESTRRPPPRPRPHPRNLREGGSWLGGGKGTCFRLPMGKPYCECEDARRRRKEVCVERGGRISGLNVKPTKQTAQRLRIKVNNYRQA